MRTLKTVLTATVAGAVALVGLTATAAPAHAADGPTFLLTNPVVAGEGDATTTMAFDLEVIGDNPQASTVGLQLTPTQVKGADSTDFAQPLSFSVVVPANASSVKVPVKIAGDQKIEADESFLVKTVSASKGQPANVSQKGTITNDDAPRVDVLDAQITESELTQKLGVQLVADQGFPAQTDVKIEAFVPQGCTATPGADFSLPDVFAKVGFNGGVKARTAFVLISGDDVPEQTECFGLRVVPSSKVEAGAHGTGRITIVDDEPLPEAPVQPNAPKGPADEVGDQGSGAGTGGGTSGTGTAVGQSEGSDSAGGVRSSGADQRESDPVRPTADEAEADRDERSNRSTSSRSADQDRSSAEESLGDVETAAAATPSDSGAPILLVAGIALVLLALAVTAWLAKRRRA